VPRVFSVQDRERLRAELVARARADHRIVGAALVGSGAAGGEDAYSDIDLALRVGPNADFDEVVADWTAWLVRAHSVVTTMDLGEPGALYRVFLLPTTLQVDVSFWAFGRFGGNGEPFSVIYGDEAVLHRRPGFDQPLALDMAWLYALHVRSALARGRYWQALWMVNGLRDQLGSVWASRSGLNPAQARGIDDLPEEARAQLAGMVPASVSREALVAAFAAALGALRIERPDLADVLDELLRTA
jgi:hypothetical protein